MNSRKKHHFLKSQNLSAYCFKLGCGYTCPTYLLFLLYFRILRVHRFFLHGFGSLWPNILSQAKPWSFHDFGMHMRFWCLSHMLKSLLGKSKMTYPARLEPFSTFILSVWEKRELWQDCEYMYACLSFYSSIDPDRKFCEPKIVIFFLPISLNMCFGCLKEPSHWDGSFEYPQHMFWMRNKENIFQYALLSEGLSWLMW